jgi:hypothetical protein
MKINKKYFDINDLKFSCLTLLFLLILNIVVIVLTLMFFN